MKPSVFALVVLFIFALLMITPVSAEEVNGTLSSAGAWLSTNAYSSGQWGYGGNPVYYLYSAELSSGMKSMVHFDQGTGGTYGCTFDANAPHGAVTTVTVTSGTHTFGTGTIGYQRLFNGAWPIPAEIGGYQYILMDNWNITGQSGTKALTLTFNHSAIYNMTWTTIAFPTITGAPTTYMVVYSTNGQTGPIGGNWTFNQDLPFYNTYNATKPAGLGITGRVYKTVQNTTYSSRAYIVNAATGAAITSQSSVTQSDFIFNVPADTIRICALNSQGVWFNSSNLFTLPVTVTPTQTPIIQGDYTLTANTYYVNQSGTTIATITSTLDPALAQLKTMDYYATNKDTGVDYNFMEYPSTVHQTFYEKIAGTWQGYDTADVDYNNAKAGIPNPISLRWDVPAGTYDLKAHLMTASGQWSDLKVTVHVGSGSENLIQTRFQAMDSLNGGILQMVSMQIYDHNTGNWTNISPNNGLGTILTPANHIFTVYAQKPGFTNGLLSNALARATPVYEIAMYAGAAKPPGYVSYFVSVQEPTGASIPGALISIRNTVSGETKTASTSYAGGAYNFNLTNSTLHTWTVVKQGYQTQSGSFTTPVSGSGSLLVIMGGGTPTPTIPRTIPTGVYTVPTTGPAGNVSGTGFWAPWWSMFGQMGAHTSEMPLLLAGILIIFCMAAGAGMAGVLGAEVGMGFGAIFCVAVGFIPLWVVIAIIVLGFLFYGLKISGK